MTLLRRPQILVALVLAAAAQTLSAPSARAFVLLGGQGRAHLDISTDSPIALFHWDGKAPPIKEPEAYGIGDTGEALDDHDIMLKLIHTSMAVWSQVPGAYIELEVDENPDAVLARDDHANSIVVSALASATTAAAASPEIEDTLITDCDIMIGSRAVTAKSLAFTIMHELGHCIGLGHNHTNYQSVMGYSRTSESLHLSLDDISGVTYLYPAAALASEKPHEMIRCGTIHTGAGGAARAREVGFLFVLAVPMLALIFARLAFTEAWSRRTGARMRRALTVSVPTSDRHHGAASSTEHSENAPRAVECLRVTAWR